LNDIGRNSSLGNSKKIAKFLMRTFACRSTFLYVFIQLASAVNCKLSYCVAINAFPIEK
jgi:hypothetical protein